MPRRKDLRLLAPAAAAWGVAWAAVAAPEVGVPAWVPAAALWAVSGTMAAAIAMHVTLRSRDASAHLRPMLAALLLAASAAALVAHSAWVGADARAASPLAAAATSGDEVDVVVELTGAAAPMRSGFETPWGAPAEPRVGFDGMLVSVDASAARRIPVSAVGAHVDGLVFGARAAFTARVDRQPADEQAAYRLRATGEIDAAPPTGVLGSAAALRAGFAESAARLGGDGGALVPGLAIGDTSAVGAELDADMKVASLAQL